LLGWHDGARTAEIASSRISTPLGLNSVEARRCCMRADLHRRRRNCSTFRCGFRQRVLRPHRRVGMAVGRRARVFLLDSWVGITLQTIVEKSREGGDIE
jgi:hypothetical protein